MRKGDFDNSGKLVRFALRRERLISAVWIVVMLLFSAALAPGMESMFPDAESREQIAAIYDNPIMTSIMGPVYGTGEDFTVGAMYGSMMLLWVIIAVGVMNIFLVIRHTRADEEGGRAEVIRSLPVGRLAGLNAALTTALIVDFIMGLLIALGLAATGANGVSFGGSMLYGALIFASGFLFAAAAALFCQLSSGAGGAKGLSFAVMGVFYMLRAAGDMQGNETLACISPIGLAARSQVYVRNNWWPFIVLLAEGLLIAAAAYKLNAVRDLGQGFIPARPGRREAGPYLGSSLGLSWRLLRAPLTVWLIVMALLGASYGTVIGDIDEFVGDSPDYLAIIGVNPDALELMSDAQKKEIIVDTFGSFITSMMTLLCLVPLLSAAMRPRNEEKEHRAEHILSRSVGRRKYLAGYVIHAYAAGVFIQCATAVGLYGSAAAGENNTLTLGNLLKAYLAYLPALWVMIGLAVLLVGLLPKASGAVWGIFGAVCFISFVGVMVLPEWMLYLSPLHYIPQLPLEEFSILPLAALTLIAAALTAAGFVFYKKRDMLTV